MNEKELALKIINEEGVQVATLKKCFKCREDENDYFLKMNPNMCCGLYRYNEAIQGISGAYKLNISQYNLLKKVLTNM